MSIINSSSQLRRDIGLSRLRYFIWRGRCLIIDFRIQELYQKSIFLINHLSIFRLQFVFRVRLLLFQPRFFSLFFLVFYWLIFNF